MHNPGGAGLYLPFNAWGWIFASLMICLGLWHITSKGELVSSRLLQVWGGAIVLMLLPMAWSDATLRDYALPRLGGLVGGGLFLFSLYQFRLAQKARQQLLTLMLVAIAIEMTLGLVQYYLLTPGNWLGYDTKANRPYGIFQQPNVMASFMATGLSLAAWLNTLNQHRWLKALQGYVIVGSVVLLIVLQSRVGQLGGILALLMMLPWLKRNHALKVTLSCVLLGVLFGLASLYGVEGVKRGLSVYQSGGYRTIYWSYALHLLSQHPFTGWGHGSFESVFLHNYMADKLLNPAMPQIEYNLDHPHNELLYWAVEGGILPVIGLLVMGAAVIWRVAGQSRSHGLALLALVVPITLHTQVEYPLYHSIAHWIFLLMLVWYIDETCGADAARGIAVYRYPHKLLLRFLAVSIPLFIVPFMLTALHTAWVVTKYERGGYKEPALLLDIINPMAWLTRVEFDVNAVRLMVGLQTQNKTELEAYLAWGQDFVRHTPRANIYANMVVALNELGRPDEARNLRAEALRWYPKEPLLIEATSKPMVSGVDTLPTGAAN
ncbi:Wzy polymerase domain-containing protein [Aeromonas veronii]|uniref:PglL family O-oligosaccharyltransferase n=1 Tax=Aeromonas veronii TaxID=654 RepID=UPI003BA38E3C